MDASGTESKVVQLMKTFAMVMMGSGLLGLGACAGNDKVAEGADSGVSDSDDSGDGGQDAAPWSFSADLAADADAWVPFVSDYPEAHVADVQFTHEVRTLELGDGSTASGVYQYVWNIADDVFAGAWRPVDVPDGADAFHIELTVATPSPRGCVGGGSSVYVKAGLLVGEPDTYVDDDGWVWPTFDKGQQSNESDSFRVVGMLQNEIEDCSSTDWGVVTLSTEAPIEIDPEDGQLNLFLATESAFESFHEVLFIDVELRAAE